MSEFIELFWNDIESYCEDISNGIKKDAFTPDMIISIGRGGMIPARILSDKLGLHNVHLFGIKLYNDVGEQMENAEIENFDICVKDKNILLVDDLVDSGKTMEILVNEMTNRGAKKIAKAALLKKDIDNSYSVDYYSAYFEKDEWVVFPWEVHEFKIVEKNKKKTKVCLA
jgi:hypoxanthine phosphoribosyltransferase